jgi:hypothetical protein
MTEQELKDVIVAQAMNIVKLTQRVEELQSSADQYRSWWIDELEKQKDEKVATNTGTEDED